jgi:hypothetical protein
MKRSNAPPFGRAFDQAAWTTFADAMPEGER